MRWKRKIVQYPKIGDIRIKKRFLWFPKCLNDEYRWLCVSSFTQEYIIVKRPIVDTRVWIPVGIWRSRKWVEN
jgi:hypothetical protein